MFNLFGKTQTILLGILGAISVFLFGRNSKLTKENVKLNQDNNNLESKVELAKKVKHAIKNTKHTDIDGNIKRMRKGKL